MKGFPYDVEIARGLAWREGSPGVVICRGPEKGCIDGDPTRCVYCYRIEGNDPRSSEQIVADMDRGDA